MSVFFPGTQCPLPRARWCSSCPWCRWPQHSQSCNSSPRLGQEGFGVILNGGGKSYFKCYLYPVSSPCWLVQLPLALFCPSSFSFCLSFPLLVTLGSCVWSLPLLTGLTFPALVLSQLTIYLTGILSQKMYFLLKVQNKYLSYLSVSCDAFILWHG